MRLPTRHLRFRVRPQRHIFTILLIFFVMAPASMAFAQNQLLVELSKDSVLVTNSGLIWQHERSEKTGNFLNMKNYVSTREIEGWRLPTKQELYELVEIFDLRKNGSITMDVDESYWLTDDSGDTVTGAWEIGDQCGPSRSYYPHKRGYIRLVQNQ